MGSSFMRLGGAAVETVGSQLFKRLGKEADHIGKVIAKQAPEVTETLIKEVDNYPPAGEYIKGLYRNGELDELQEYVTDLRRGASNKQVSNNVQEIVNKSNKPEVAAQPKYPTKYDVKGKEGRDYVHGQLSNWLREQQGLVDSGQIKKIDRSQFAPGGLIIDGKERGISGITEHIKSGYQSRIKMDSVGPAQIRAQQADPSNVQGLKEWFDSGNQTWKETGGQQGVHPDLNFEEFRSSVTRGAAKADEVTSELAKELGIKLDKEHMASLGGRGSNDPRSQVPGSASYNRSMGKIDSFNREVMEILGLPGSGSMKSAPTRKSAQVALKDSQKAQKGWWQSATDWVATDGGTMDDMSKWNPGDLLTDVDKLRIQQQPGAGQAKLAMQILAERQILQAYIQAGLGKTPNERELLGKILKHIDAKTALKKAIAEAKEKAKPGSLTDRISKSKYNMNEPKVTKIPRGQ